MLIVRVALSESRDAKALFKFAVRTVFANATTSAPRYAWEVTLDFAIELAPYKSATDKKQNIVPAGNIELEYDITLGAPRLRELECTAEPTEYANEYVSG